MPDCVTVQWQKTLRINTIEYNKLLDSTDTYSFHAIPQHQQTPLMLKLNKFILTFTCIVDLQWLSLAQLQAHQFPPPPHFRAYGQKKATAVNDCCAVRSVRMLANALLPPFFLPHSQNPKISLGFTNTQTRKKRHPCYQYFEYSLHAPSPTSE